MQLVYSSSLAHHGIKGMRWGVRRYQNADGSLTPAGERRYNIQNARSDYKNAKKEYANNKKQTNKEIRKLATDRERKEKRNALVKSRLDLIDKHVTYEVAKKRSEKAKNRAEKEVYRNSMAGVRGSLYDIKTGGSATAVYDHIRTRKGKAYADKIEKRIGREALAVVALGSAALIGNATVAAMLTHGY